MKSFEGFGAPCTLHGREAVISVSNAAAIRGRTLAALGGLGAIAGRLLFPPDPMTAAAQALARAFTSAAEQWRRMVGELEALGARLRALEDWRVEGDRRKARRRARRTGERFRVEVRRGRKVFVFRRRGAEGGSRNG